MPSGPSVPGQYFPTPALPPGASGTVAAGATPGPLGLPALSLPGNLIGLALNGAVMVWAWRRGGACQILSVVAGINSLYFVGKIQGQV